MRRIVAIALAAAALVAFSGCGNSEDRESDADLQIYSARHYDLEKAFKDFTKETGITVDFLFGDDAELLERIKAEGDRSPADIFMTVDAGMLVNAARSGILQPVDSQVLRTAVPADLRDADGEWFGLSMRARTLMYNPDKVSLSDFDPVNSYAGLGDPRWKGKVCMRTASASYTQSLVASLIAAYGETETRAIVQSWIDNDVQILGNDIELLETLAAGGCHVGITNHYYLGRLLAEDPDFNVKPFWASQQGQGTHVNISGAGITKAADNVADAQKLLEWLATDGQSAFVDDNHEYPVNPKVKPEPLIAGFGEFKRMKVDAKAYAENNAAAVDLLAELGYE